MKKAIIGMTMSVLMLAGTAVPSFAAAPVTKHRKHKTAKRVTTGAVGGAAVGAVAGGPVGAVVGAGAGAVAGKAYDNHKKAQGK